MTVIRSASLRGFRSLVAELGGDAEEFAAAAELPAAALDADDLLIPINAMMAALQCAAVELACPDLGLRIAARQDISVVGPLAIALQSCSSVQEALTCTTRYLFLHSPSVTLDIEPDSRQASGVVAVRFGILGCDGEYSQAADLGMGILHRSIIGLVGGRYGLRSVELPYQPTAPLSAYETFFQTTVHTNTAAALLRVPHTLLKLPLNGRGNTHIRQLAEAFLAQQVSPDTPPHIVPRVRIAIQQSLATAPPDITTIADLMSLHPRTLQRRLAREGASFGRIVDDVRRHAARHYLVTTDMPMTQVTSLLGLSEQSALSRCCQRWWDATPTAVRRNPTLADLG